MPKLARKPRKGQEPAPSGVRRSTKKPRSEPSSTTEQELRNRIARRAKRLREEAGLTQEEAAERAHMDVRTWQKIEAGTLNLTVDKIADICNALEIEPSALVAKLTT